MLSIKNLKKKFPGVFALAINAISLEIEEGDFCVLIGPNGSGKSTLLRMISGECKPTSGSVECKGIIREVLQDVGKGTVADMTVFENILLSYMHKPCMMFYSRYKDEIKKKWEMLDCGMEQYLDMPVSVLSGGQRQILATFMAINSMANMLLLDEHTAALDPVMQKFLMEYTARSIKEQGLTAVMSTHKMSDALLYGNRLIVLNRGRVVLDTRDKSHLTERDLVNLFYQDADANVTTNNGGGK